MGRKKLESITCSQLYGTLSGFLSRQQNTKPYNTKKFLQITACLTTKKNVKLHQ
jgi:hypothetical protein